MTSTDTSLPATEADERDHLQNVRERIQQELHSVSDKVQAQYNDMMATKMYLQESKADMDHVEKVSVKQSIDQISRLGEHGVGRQNRMAKLVNSPYFGRIDFQPAADGRIHPVYIGVHSFHDTQTDTHLVHDWRAPISSMFYDFETGEAWYDAPDGRRGGEISLKRQYRVEEGELVFMLETSLNIQDDVLQEELSRTSSDKMKNIVATIQRDQNAIIRNDHARALILQGAAGSGKTSIALHRIAYLLYKYKDEIDSSEILIISPNKVFAHYISSVLPELGEEMIKETTMEILAEYLLGYKVRFQTFAEQVAKLLEDKDEAFKDRIRYKSSPHFLSKLDEYARHVKNNNLTVTDVTVDLTLNVYTVPADYLAHRFSRNANLSFTARVTDGVTAVVEYMQSRFQKEITGAQRTPIRNQIKAMFACTHLKSFYKQFYTWADAPDMFKMGKKSSYEYADVFPYIYLGMLLEGFKGQHTIKHLVIDEMQDYTSVQYQVINKVFACKKTILGDYHQSVNPYSSTPAETIREVMSDAECMYMHKSYRSTVEITRFAQRIQPNPDLEPIERHGSPPQILACDSEDAEISALLTHLREFLDSDHHSLGLICKTQQQADALYGKIKHLGDRVHLLDAASNRFNQGILLATAHLAKGLEFDRVLIPFCCDKNYRTIIDRHMLYVACTRAMHRLTLTHTGKPSPFIEVRR
ncbi:MAG: 3'-5' exonuclease [Opitutales bacterium]